MKIAMRPVPGAVGWFRAIGPGSYLEELGHEVIYLDRSKGMTEERAREVILEADVVLVVGPKTQFDRVSAEFHDRRGALVVDLDDDVWAWLGDPSSKDGPVETIEPRDAEAVESWLRAADLVTTTTPYLAEVLRGHGAREVLVTPNALDPGAQRAEPRALAPAIVGPTPSGADRNRPCPCGSGRKVKRCCGAPARSSSGRTIGWTGNVSHIRDLPPALSAMRRVASIDASVCIRSLGPVIFTATPEWRRPPAWSVQYEPVLHELEPGKFATVVPFEAYYDALEAMAADVAVVPLRPSPFNAAKSAVTPFSWGIQGVPCVMTRFGPYEAAAEAGFPGSYIREHDDVEAWTTSIRELLYDPVAARAMGQQAKEWVLEHAAFPAGARAWETAFGRAVELRRGRVAA